MNRPHSILSMEKQMATEDTEFTVENQGLDLTLLIAQAVNGHAG